MAKYAKIFNESFLKNIETEIKVITSETGMEGLDIPYETYKRFAEGIKLRFLKKNKKQFDVDELVTLELELKNIPELHVKIFEFNTETYYKKNLAPFNTAVNLDGLDASARHLFKYDHSKNVVFREKFSFEELNGKIGLFIIEFIGNGLSARAVIKKGSLSLVHRSTIAGHLAYILDQNKQVCIGERTGAWFNDQFYQADKKFGRIFIPYGKQEHPGKIIMIHDNFA